LSRVDADGDGAAGPAARLTIRVLLRLSVGLALLLLLMAMLTKRRADRAPALLADAAACVCDRLLFLLRERWVRGGQVRGAARLLARWRSWIRILTHRATEYRRVRTQTLLAGTSRVSR
jgi:hypothetical protein